MAVLSASELVVMRRRYVAEVQAELSQVDNKPESHKYVAELTNLVKKKAQSDPLFPQKYDYLINRQNCRNDLAALKQQDLMGGLVKRAVTNHNNKEECAEKNHWLCVAKQVAALVFADKTIKRKNIPGHLECQNIAESLGVQLTKKTSPVSQSLQVSHQIGVI